MTDEQFTEMLDALNRVAKQINKLGFNDFRETINDSPGVPGPIEMLCIKMEEYKPRIDELNTQLGRIADALEEQNEKAT